jgi:hypothetical protein
MFMQTGRRREEFEKARCRPRCSSEEKKMHVDVYGPGCLSEFAWKLWMQIYSGFGVGVGGSEVLPSIP